MINEAITHVSQDFMSGSGTEPECRDVRDHGGDRGSSRPRLNIGQSALLTQGSPKPSAEHARPGTPGCAERVG